MRRPQRNIEIFSMSVLDMFASALGAFIMIAIILFPYYQKNKPVVEKLNALLEEQRKTQEDLDSLIAKGKALQASNLNLTAALQSALLAQVSLNRCKQDEAACIIELGATFLLVKIEWSDEADVDLHVTDPKGNRFNFLAANRNGTRFPDSKAQLSTDTARGPGVEVWQTPHAEPGNYVIEYVVEDDPGREIVVKGLVFEKTERRVIGEKRLGKGVRRVVAGTVQVHDDGRIELR